MKEEQNYQRGEVTGLTQQVLGLIDYELEKPKTIPRIREVLSQIERIIEDIKGGYGSHPFNFPPITPYELEEKLSHLENLVNESDIPLQLELVKKKIVDLYKSIYGEEVIEKVIKKEEEKQFKEALKYAGRGNKYFVEEALEKIKVLRELEGRTFPEEKDKERLKEIWNTYKRVGVPYIVGIEIEKAKGELRMGNKEEGERCFRTAKGILEGINETLPKKVEEEINWLLGRVDLYKEAKLLRQAIRKAEKGDLYRAMELFYDVVDMEKEREKQRNKREEQGNTSPKKKPFPEDKIRELLQKKYFETITSRVRSNSRLTSH